MGDQSWNDPSSPPNLLNVLVAPAEQVDAQLKCLAHHLTGLPVGRAQIHQNPKDEFVGI